METNLTKNKQYLIKLQRTLKVLIKFPIFLDSISKLMLYVAPNHQNYLHKFQSEHFKDVHNIDYIIETIYYCNILTYSNIVSQIHIRKSYEVNVLICGPAVNSSDISLLKHCKIYRLRYNYLSIPDSV